MAITFKFLEAGAGDAILISADDKNILVDGGERYSFINASLQQIKKKKQFLDLVILTHVDNDHINGLIGLLEKPIERQLIKELWFNSFENDGVSFSEEKSKYDTGYVEGISFNELVSKMNKENKNFKYKSYVSTETKGYYFSKNLYIDILSPTKQSLDKLYKEYKKEIRKKRNSGLTSGEERLEQETIESLANYKFKKDTSVKNGSSIAFILTYKEKYRFLLLADAHIDVIIESLKERGFNKNNKLNLDFVKLSHHGSKHNLNQEFLDLIETENYIISTNGKYQHPDLETLSKIIINAKNKKIKSNLYFNYKDIAKKTINLKNFDKSNREKYNFCFFSISEKGLIFGDL